MTHVFININNPLRVKMIDAPDLESANLKLYERLKNEPLSGFHYEYYLGFYL